jgi:transcriptional regulator with XRE-family HTH domain
MYKNRGENGRCNLCGEQIAQWRKESEPYISQRALADMLQLAGLDIDKNAVQRIESGQRFVTDIELKVIAQVLGLTTDELLQ